MNILKQLMFTGIYGFRTDSFERAVKAAAEIGYDGLEIRALSHLAADSTKAQAREMRQMLDAYGITAPCIFLGSANYRESEEAGYKQLDEIKRYTEFAEELGASMIAHKPASPSPRKATEQDYESAAIWMSRVADLLAEHKVKLILETHTGNLLETVDSCLKLWRLINRSNVGFALDIGNFAIAGEDYGEEAVERLGETIWHVHCKDISFFQEKPVYRHTGAYNGTIFAVDLMGKGQVDHKPAYRALLASGYNGYFTMETLAQGVDLIPEEVARHDYEAFIQDIRTCMT
jgi:sugar phosphate isomerase/epimerase